MKKITLVLLGMLVVSIPLFANGGRQAAGTGTDGLSLVKILGRNTESTLAGKRLRLSDWYEGTIPSRIWEAFTVEMARRGIKLELDLIMADQMPTVFQTIMASGKMNDYDMISGTGVDQIIAYNLYTQNRLYAWNKAIDQYSAGPAGDYYANDEAGKYFKRLHTLEDGNLYWLNGTSEFYYKNPDYPVGSLMAGQIRMDWLEAAGLGIPKTMDEFYDALMTFQQKDINKNGVKDEVAQISLENFNTGLAQWFGLGNGMISFIDSKAVSPWYQPRIQDYISYMNRLYKAGLLRVDSEGGAMAANRIAYKYDWVGAIWDEPIIVVPSGAAKPYFAPFVVQAASDNPARIYAEQGRTITWGPSFIPIRAKNIEGVVKIIDYQVTNDYSVLTESGIEGYSFRYDSDGNIVEGETNPNNVGLDVELINGAYACLWANNVIPRHYYRDMYTAIITVTNQGHPLRANFFETGYNKTYPFISDINSLMAFPRAAETERIAAITPDLTTYSNELLTSLIMGEKSLANWNAYMSDLKRLGLDELIGIYQTRLDRGR